MNRRGFLSTLLAGAATVAADPERLIWVPGKKTISIPKPVESALHRAYRTGKMGPCGYDWYQDQIVPMLLENYEFSSPFDSDTPSIVIYETITKDEFRRRYPPVLGIPDEVIRPSPVVFVPRRHGMSQCFYPWES